MPNFFFFKWPTSIIFPHQNLVWNIFSPIHSTWLAHLILIDLCIRTVFAQDYKTQSFTSRKLFQSVIAYYLFDLHIFLSTPFSNSVHKPPLWRHATQKYEKSYSETHAQVGSKFMIINGRLLGQTFSPLIRPSIHFQYISSILVLMLIPWITDHINTDVVEGWGEGWLLHGRVGQQSPRIGTTHRKGKL